jgi:hypothetical protein
MQRLRKVIISAELMRLMRILFDIPLKFTQLLIKNINENQGQAHHLFGNFGLRNYS